MVIACKMPTIGGHILIRCLNEALLGTWGDRLIKPCMVIFIPLLTTRDSQFAILGMLRTVYSEYWCCRTVEPIVFYGTGTGVLSIHYL